jgi:hypothetical protein
MKSLATVVICCVAILVSDAAPCHQRISKAEAIRLAKKQLAHDWGRKVLSGLGPYTAELDGCVWKVVAVTPGFDGDFYIEVGAETGKAWVGPHLRTDPKKIGKLTVPKSQ